MKSIANIHQKHEKGQILVILALVFIGLVAIVGLAVDMGYYYISYARLRRAVDAAALGATMQFKKNVGSATLQKAAREFLVLNGVPNSNSLAADVDTCTTLPGDPELCTTPRRKLVRVTAKEDVPMFFMAILGMNSLPIQVTSISEAATVDVVLVIDRSESMGIYKEDNITKLPVPSMALDPYICNDSHPSTTPDASDPSTWTGNCHPFHEVKSAAVSFVNEFMDPEYDRVAIVVFDNEAYPVNFGTTASPVYFSSDQNQILQSIRGLWMYDGFRDTGGGADRREPDQYYEWQIDPADGIVKKVALKGHACSYKFPDLPLPGDNEPPCRALDDTDRFYQIDCAGIYNPDLYGTPVDGSRCGSTNIGRGLWWAANIFKNYGAREESLLVTILLTDGVPNAGYDAHDPPRPICPPSTRARQTFCVDTNALIRHTFDPSSDALYDADDYARDWADALASPDTVGSLIFTIGLGPAVTSTKYADPGTPAPGVTLLNYISQKGLTGEYYQAGPDDLQKIFLAIANKIATRLTK